MIRKLKSIDFNALVALFSQLYKLHYEAREDVFNIAQPITEPYFREILHSRFKFCYVYEENGKVIGAILIKKIHTDPYVTLKTRLIYEIYDLVVDAKYRRQGIGTKLYKFILDLAHREGADAVQVEAWAFNFEAIKFYESLGMNVKKFTFEQLTDNKIRRSTSTQMVRTITTTKLKHE